MPPRRRSLLFGGVGVVVLALVAGVLALGGGSGGDAGPAGQQAGAKRDLQPFRAAVDDLAAAPGLRYEDTSAFGITENEITVTAGGSQFGTTSSGGTARTDRDVLRIDGKTFLRWQEDPGGDPESDRDGDGDGKGKEDGDDAAGAARPSEWMVGLEDGSTLVDEALSRTLAPGALAEVLSGALTALEKNPSAEYDPQQRSKNVNGTPALGMDTSAGRLWVTERAPHRVLRLEPYDLGEGIDDLRDQLEKGRTPTAGPSRVTTGPLASGDSDGMDLTPVLHDAAPDMYDTLVTYAEQLKDATEHGINFTLDGSGDMNCSAAGCRATQKFTGQVSSKARKDRVTDGKVTAVMSATFSIDGQAAGACTSAARTFTLSGSTVSGSLNCSNPGAGALFAAVDAKYKARAEAESRARNGATVTYRIPLRAHTVIDARALAEVEVRKLIDRAKRERDGAAKCSAPGSTTQNRSTQSRSTQDRSVQAGADGSHAYYTGTGDAAPLLVDDSLVTVYHYTDKDGYNGIRACKPYYIKPGKSKNGPGPFFTTRSPAELTDPNAFKKLGITHAKSQYVMEFQVPRSELKPLRGDRGKFIFTIPGGATVDRNKARYFGPTSGWTAP